ncbi:MAG: hypothetical protein R2932_20705 [Caldilineaceae bacterium]
MTTILAQIAPQRSTQYADLVRLAIPELQLSPPVSRQLTSHLSPWSGLCTLYLAAGAGQATAPRNSHVGNDQRIFHPARSDRRGRGTTVAALGERLASGNFPDLVATRRYRGKTNELFTHFLCNVARASSAFAHEPWQNLTVMDPLMGGGTTLFVALMLGAQKVGGVDSDTDDVRSTATFLQQYLQNERISHKMQPERLKGLGLRWQCTIGKKGGDRPLQECILANGDTRQTQTLLPGFKPHLLVADLPYGVQHQGQLNTLLLEAMPQWLAMLRRGGAVALAWDATRFERSKMIGLLQTLPGVQLHNDSPYDALTHSVDRVIKARDVVFLTKM